MLLARWQRKVIKAFSTARTKRTTTTNIHNKPSQNFIYFRRVFFMRCVAVLRIAEYKYSIFRCCYIYSIFIIHSGSIAAADNSLYSI